MSPVFAGSTFIRPHINLGYGEDRPGGVKSLPELIEFASEHNPDHIFGLQSRAGEVVSHDEMTFSQLQSAVEFASAWLVSSGLTTGRVQRDDPVKPVGILLGSDISIFIYMAALLRIGTPVLMLSARLTPVAIAHLVKKTAPTCVLTSSQISRSSKETLALLESEGDTLLIPRFVEALGYEELFNPDSTQQEIEIPPPYTAYQYNDLDAVIMHSSGTTGLPKPVFHSQTYPLVYAACHRLPDEGSPFRFNVSTLPLYHGFGLLAPSLSLSIGMPFILPSASIIPTAKTTLAALQSSGARYMFSVPSILEDMLRLPGDVGIETLKGLEIVAIGGAPMKENIGSELVTAGVNLLNHWGATEIGAIAPIERIPRGYDWHYLMPRSDLGLKFIPLDDGSNSYRLVGCAPGWKEPHIVQDLLVIHPHDQKQFRILGRADDLIVLATGEKVRATNLERIVAEHPDIKDVLAFGEGQFSIGLLVELVAGKAEIDLDLPENMEALLTSIEPYLERGNSFTDKHGKVTKEMVIFTRETIKPLIRTDKGTLARKPNLAAFDAEIRACYEAADILKAAPLPLPEVDGGHALRYFIRSLVQSISEHDDFGDNVDFFEAGMDSLQASRLRRSLLNSLRVTPGLLNQANDLEPDFCFENSSIEKLHRAISWVMSGTHLDEIIGETKEARRLAAMEDMVEKYREELANYSCLAAHARIARRKKRIVSSQGSIVLLTGSTGSLGCFLLARLATDPTVSKIICLNRPKSGSACARQRQMDLMIRRGAHVPSAAWEKVVLYEADMSRFDFGLDEENFAGLLGVTHIIHNAWPVNFRRNLSSFEPHVKALSNLVRLSLLSSGARPAGTPPTRLLFASSIAVAGRYPIVNPKGHDVPETALEAVHTAEFGYPEAKWVCEKVLLAAVELYGDAFSVEEQLIQGSSVRIGQMTGPEGSGVWNENEHFPIIVRTSQALKALPALSGSLSWFPVNRAGNVLIELLFSKSFKPFYHMENPSRQSWSGLLHNLATILGGESAPLPLIPFPEWLDRVRALRDDPTLSAAFKILGFLENDFVRMATGNVILRTSTTRLDSPTMVQSTSMDKKHLEEYIAYWRSVGAMS